MSADAGSGTSSVSSSSSGSGIGCGTGSRERSASTPPDKAAPSDRGASAPTLLQLESLSLRYRGRSEDALCDVDLEISAGQAFGLVGESGSGKSSLALAAIFALPEGATLRARRLRLAGKDLRDLTPSQRRRLWRRSVGFVPQDPFSALNPSMRVGRQLREALPRGPNRRARLLEALREVQLPDPRRIAARYPHELSGGMAQRVMIAMALAGSPDLLVLDEPTTALDVTTQAAVLDLLRELLDQRSTALLFVSHDLAVVSALCDRVGVMFEGRLVEQGSSREILERPRHMRTRALIESFAKLESGDRASGADGAARSHVRRMPGVRRKELEAEGPPTLDVEKLSVHYPLPRGIGEILRVRAPKRLRAVIGVDLSVQAGETLALVGESGSGKSSLAHAVAGLVTRAGGRIRLAGEPLAAGLAERGPGTIGAIQMVFQHPGQALNPYRKVGHALKRPLVRLLGLDSAEAERRVGELLEAVQLDRDLAQRKPGQLSGGELQRVSIARAFACRPKLVLLDEPVASLDMSIRADVLDLLARLQRRDGSACLFITHDLATIGRVADAVAVMYLGEIVEFGSPASLDSGPLHPYTEALLSALPRLTRARAMEQGPIRLRGDAPSPVDRPSGCPFHSRCPRLIDDRCREEVPPWRESESGARIRCHIPLEQLIQLQSPAPKAEG